MVATLQEPTYALLHGEELHPAVEGAVFSNLPADHPLRGSLDGAVIISVDDRSPAAARGLRAGDLVIGANRVRIESIEQLRDIGQTSSGSTRSQYSTRQQPIRLAAAITLRVWSVRAIRGGMSPRGFRKRQLFTVPLSASSARFALASPAARDRLYKVLARSTSMSTPMP